MKILQMVPYFYPAWAYGGPGKVVYDFASYFASTGNQVTVYTSDAYDSTSRMPEKLHVNKKNLHVRYFKNLNNYLAYHYNVFFTPGLFIKSLFEVQSFDIIHIHDFYTLQNFFVGILARVFKVPYILSVHGCLEDARLQQKNAIKKIFLWLYGYQFLRHATKVVATSDNERTSYLDLGIPKEKIIRLAHGVSLKDFNTTISSIVARKKLNLPAGKTLVTFLGRIHKIKGLDKLAEAIKLLQDRKDVHFVIAGSDDGYLSTLLRLLKKYDIKNVTLMGTCIGEEKKLLFKASDMFIYPSYSEGFSLGILEAGAAGLPLILSKGCHFDEVETSRAGIITDNNPRELKKAILKIIDNNEFRKQAADNAKKLIESKYSLTAISNTLLKVYSDVL